MSVRLRVPAQSQYLALVRALAASQAMRANLTLDRLEDLRLAVDEAASHLMTAATPAEMIDCYFRQVDGSLVVEVRTRTESDHLPAESDFGWKVLRALVDSVDARMIDGEQVLTMRMRSTAAGS